VSQEFPDGAVRRDWLWFAAPVAELMQQLGWVSIIQPATEVNVRIPATIAAHR
jgi:hypothetical protein